MTLRKAYSVNKQFIRWPRDKRRSTKLKRFLELAFQVGKLPSSVNGRSLIDVTMSTVSVIRLLISSFITCPSCN